MINEPLILVADDERDIRELVSFTLQMSGFQIIEVTNGEEAVKEVAKTKPDLIILDVRMPKMTGYEVCEIFKNQERTKDIPIIFLSAKGQDAEIRLGLELGAEEYIVKPFVPDELAECVNKVLVSIAYTPLV